MDDEELKSEVSVRKIEANRENAKRSTGPKTEKGKRNSSRNAMTHGLLSKELVIADKESREEFEQLLEELIEDFQPQGRAELSLIETVAISDWRYRRSLCAETAEIAGDLLGLDRVLPNVDETNKILRYQTAIHRQKMQAMQLLERLRQRRGISLGTNANAQPEGEKEADDGK
jgi:hypothetical protein